MPISLGIGTAITRGGGIAWSPLSISGLQFWVDAADSATLYTDSTLATLAVADGDVIGGWKDKSGNSRNALQTDGTKKPLLKLAIQNGRNIVRYDGTNDTNEMASGYQVNPSTTFLAIKSSYVSADDVVMGIVPYAAPGYLIDYFSVTGIAGPTGTTSGLTNNNAYHVVCVRYGPTISRVRQDGTDGFADTSTNLFGLIGRISGYSYLGGGAYFQGDIGEIIAYNSVLSGSDILLVEEYLKAKWGTP
jgi:hypothetical protein